MSPLTEKNVREGLTISVVDNKGKSFSPPPLVDSIDLPLEFRCKAILHLLLVGKPGSASMQLLVHC
jgi:hypothetical protein